MRDLITTGFDAAGVLALAIGAGFAAAAAVGPAGIAASGVVLLGAVRLHDWLTRREAGGRR